MTSYHRRLNDLRDRAIRDPAFRPVYAHALTVAHLQGALIAADHPAWAGVEAALAALRRGEAEAVSALLRELLRLRPPDRPASP